MINVTEHSISIACTTITTICSQSSAEFRHSISANCRNTTTHLSSVFFPLFTFLMLHLLTSLQLSLHFIVIIHLFTTIYSMQLTHISGLRLPRFPKFNRFAFKAYNSPSMTNSRLVSKRLYEFWNVEVIATVQLPFNLDAFDCTAYKKLTVTNLK